MKRHAGAILVEHNSATAVFQINEFCYVKYLTKLFQNKIWHNKKVSRQTDRANQSYLSNHYSNDWN